MSNVKKAVIIGGGPAGLAAALRLKTHNNIDTAIYETRSEPMTLGGAVQIPPNGLRLFDRLGVLKQLESRGSSASRFILHSTQSAVLLDNDRAAWSREKMGYGFMRVLRSDVIEVLLTAVREANILVHYGKHLNYIEERNDGVTAGFSDGTTATGDLLLGCDGIHSAVRRIHVSANLMPEYSGISNMFSIVPKSRLSPEAASSISDALHGTLTPEGLLAVTPCTASSDQIYWFYSREVAIPNKEDDREGWAAFGEKEVAGFKSNVLRVIKNANGDWAECLRELVNQTDAIKFYPIYKMPLVSNWATRRCILVGDSAHAMQPHVGQGTSMALEDVFVLSRLLEDESRSLEEVCERFEAIRRPRVEAIARASTEGGEIRKDTSPFKLKMKEKLIEVGYWAYSMTGLQRWGIGMNQKDYTYDVVEEVL